MSARPHSAPTAWSSARCFGEDGEDMGTYDFRTLVSDCPPGLVLPLVAGLAMAAGPGGRWRRRASVRRGADIVRAFAREIVTLYPQLDAIGDLSPEMYRTWFREVRSRSVWPGLIVSVRNLLGETDGVPRETLQEVRTMSASKPDHGASGPYPRSESRRIGSALRAGAFAGYARVAPNDELLAQYRAGEEPPDAPRWELNGEVYSKGGVPAIPRAQRKAARCIPGSQARGASTCARGVRLRSRGRHASGTLPDHVRNIRRGSSHCLRTRVESRVHSGPRSQQGGTSR